MLVNSVTAHIVTESDIQIHCTPSIHLCKKNSLPKVTVATASILYEQYEKSPLCLHFGHSMAYENVRNKGVRKIWRNVL
jgi:hypothetical protein